MLNVNYIRSQIGVIAPSGAFVEAAVRNIVREAERYAEECVDKSLTGTLFEQKNEPPRGSIAMLKRDLHGILSLVQSRKLTVDKQSG